MEPEPAAEHAVVESEVDLIDRVENVSARILDDCDTNQIEIEIKKKKEDIKTLNNRLRECKSRGYTYGGMTLERLIHVIKKENKETVYEFLELFPRVAETRGKQLDDMNHVFEALWILSYYFNLDLGEDERYDRVFYKNLEKGGDKIDKSTFLKNKVNDGSGSGIVDIYFTHEDKNTSKSKTKYIEGTSQNWNDPPSCVDAKPRKVYDTFLCSAKFFKKEKSGDKYDVAQIVIEADEVFNNSGEGKPFEYNIVLLVKDKEELQLKLNRTDKTYAKRIHKIYDLTDLNKFYNQIKNIDLQILKEKNIKSNYLVPRFHQKYFIDYTKLCIENGDKKFAWGAVPRSGKSFMIGGLISELKPKYVFLILGAITETKNQFINELFLKEKKGFSDFDDYCVHDLQRGVKYRPKNSRHIYVCSQEMVRMKTTGKKKNAENKKELPEDVRKILKEEKDKIIFFDEIHQGSGPKSQQEDMLKKIVFDNEYKAFVMVTATFAKPYLRYMDVGGTNTKLIQWRYEDIQNMKNIGDVSFNEITGEKIYHVYNDLVNEIKQENDGDIKFNIFEDIVKQYSLEGKTLEHLASEYIKYPELFVSTPMIEEIPDEYKEGENSIINDEEINIEEILQPLTELQKHENIIKKSSKCNSYLEYLQKEIYEKYILNTLKYDITYPHSEIWFLPTTLRGMKKELEDETGKGNDKRNDKKNKRSPFRNMSKNLTILMMKNEYFRKNYCVAIMHGLGFDDSPIEMIHEDMEQGGHSISWSEASVQNTCKIMKDKGNEICITTICPQDKNIKDCLLKQEAYAKMNNKSLLILTGQMMRLGVSLPCVDIALHMDPINSVDTIYQSMFRVLTERPGKDKGIFIDILTKRNIKFIYDMVDYNIDKKIPTIDYKKKEIFDKIVFYNYNGISILKNDKYQDIYNKLIQSFDLNDDDKFLKRINKGLNITSDVGDLLKSPDLILYIDPFYELMNELNINYSEKGGKISVSLEKRGDNKQTNDERTDDDKDHGGEDEQIERGDKGDKDTDKNEKKEKKNKYNQIQRFIEDIIFLFVISDDYDKLDPVDIKSNTEKYCKKMKEFLSSETKTTDIIKRCEEEIELDDKEIINCHLLNIIKGSNEKDILEKIEILKIKLIEMFGLICKDNIDGFINIYIRYIENMKKIKQNAGKISKIAPCSAEFKKSENKQGLEGVPEGVMNEIRKRLTVREEEKNLYGEVFTPIELICEMFSHIPDNVWKNPDLKWLDPANGIGNFPVVAYYKLMDTLKGYKPKDKTLSEHIIEDMLYMVELNPVNVRVCKKIFKMIDPKATPKIVKGDFLKFDSKKTFNIDKFDVIMGNPPFQVELKDNKRAGSGKTLWDRFVIDSFKILKEDGYLSFIHPQNWRRPEHPLWKIIGEKQILYLHIYSKSDGQKIFNASTRFDIYVLENKSINKNTTIIDEKNKQHSINLSKWPFLPNYEYENIKEILSDKINDTILYNTNYHSQKKYVKNKEDKEFKYEIISQINKGPTLKKLYTNDNTKPFFNTSKVILSKNEQQYPINDYNKKYGMSESIFGIKIKSEKEGDDIVKAINSDDFKEIIKATKWGAFQTDYRMFKYFKPDFYKYFLGKSSEKTPETEPEPEIVEEPEAEPMKEPEPEPMKEKGKDKECPPGKILNPKTGRCINKPKEKTPKVCPPGTELNHKTGRCNKIKTHKKATIRKKASIRKKSTIRKKHKRKNNKRTIRKRGKRV